MRILIAPDSFKGTLSAIDACDALARGIRSAGRDVDIDRCPVSDGGDGLLDAFRIGYGDRCTLQSATVRGPLGQPIQAAWGSVEDHGTRIGIIEMARASGLTLLAESERDPLRTTSSGAGELLAAAIEDGCREIIIGIGGSATCDGGAGAAQALGVQFLDEAGQIITTPIAGGDLRRIHRIDCPDTPHRNATLRIAADVTNPLLGQSGAAAVYGPQKGATPSGADQLERGLRHLASLCSIDDERPGMGAAGGMPLGLFIAGQCLGINVTLERGIDVVLDARDFDERLRQADFAITGEGSLDAQTSYGKAVAGVAERAKRAHVPIIAIVGRAEVRTLEPFARIISLVATFGEDRALHDTASCLEEVAPRALDVV